eukprot:477504_1
MHYQLIIIAIIFIKAFNSSSIDYSSGSSGPSGSSGSSTRCTDSKNLELRRDLLDVSSEILTALTDMAVDGGFEQFKASMLQFGDESFYFKSDVTGVEYNGLDEFLDEKTGLHVGLMGTLDIATYLMSSHILYRCIDSREAEMRVTSRASFWINKCETETPFVGVVTEAIDILTFVWSTKDKQWKMSSFVSDTSKVFITPCPEEL